MDLELNKDLATGKKVDKTKPEEKVRQEYEAILHDDYEYAFEQMDIEVTIQRGEKHNLKNRSERADIVIYKTTNKSKRDQSEDILGIVETKKPTRKEGVRQLQSYMSATSCYWGVWTNGAEIEYVYRHPQTGEIKTDYVYQIPKNGETFEDIGKVSKKNLKPASNLKAIFRRLLNSLYANTNISRREKLGNEMIRLIFCKIWDERYDQDALPKFRVGFEESPKEVSKRVHQLFDEVKKELVSDGVFDENDEIKLDDKSIAYVVGELEQFSLLKTNKDVVGDAFEVFAESKLVGEKGEFFTPREVVKTAVQIINPQPGQTIVDPACGSGGFLIYALEHVWEVMVNDRKYRGMSDSDLSLAKSDIARKTFFGIDKEMDLVKISKAYMAIIGDGRSGIAQQNTLHTAEDFEGPARDLFVVGDDKFKKFDIVLTNPPFGSKIKVLKEDARHFELGHVWKTDGDKKVMTNEVRDTEPQVLFIERCLEMLNDGGKLAIIIPETYFHAPKARYVLEYMKKNNNFIAVIDLAHNTFRPYNNAKTVLLILEKNRPQQENIVMAVSEEIGHDHQGKPIYRYDKKAHVFTNEIWDDTEIIRKELAEPSNPANTNTFVVKASDIKNDVYVPRYYWGKKIEALREEASELGFDFVQVKTLIDEGILETYSGHGSPPSQYKGKGTIPYVRVADIVNWGIYKNPTSLITEDIHRTIKAGGVDLKAEDLLYVSRGSYRIGSLALVSKFDTDVLLTREIHVLRVLNSNNKYGIDPFYLLYLLSHKLTQEQLPSKIFIDTTLPNIAKRYEDLYLPVDKDPKTRQYIKDRIKAVFEKRWQAQQSLTDITDEFGQIVT
ncbi:DNA methyltransferase [Candidatus Saccharibacteria bacterium CG_4_10_14_0_2_um_filter_52_9]|nr:MAG: DNA methyltransferase [Candidatus Saccharibacteria bacterium CG_4_10_14_0_2_um_filter_52_9]